MDKVEAIISLRPGARWHMNDDVLVWEDEEQVQPTESEIATEITRLQSEFDSQDYARKRKAKYNALNQFELISDDAINGTTTHRDAILAIKAEYPKPD